MNVLVLGGTGTVGSQVAANLVRRGAGVRVLTRNADAAKRLPASVSVYPGDLESPDTLVTAFDQADAVFLLNALSPTETAQGLAAVEAAQKAGVKKIVYLSVPMPEDSKHIPHFKSKIPIEEAVRQSGAKYTILRPNNFYQNDYMFRDAILGYRIYPQPIGSIGLNRVDARDIAEAAVNALLLDGYEGKEYPVIGPDPLTGESIASIYTRIFGEEVRYGGDDLDAWFEQARMVLPEWLARDLKIMYRYFQEKGLAATERDFELQREILMREPISFEAFVAETAAEWKISR
ncbi:NAD(P)H-binding protein [Cohnella sp. CFH 77786]|uniref:SDR family oxidoreductase n=1 Tax=Cohnella sp. CFH 77786 TaxID=2662265 RepID=UPI001C60B471|nr:NmrA family NAD(P)-binding protein [Cohnella sp. CFH 77786]MBW5446158.1 NAD(P)H-binding protein [Cohnella sp. CFH 77786]